jgi:hypothetical protein
VHGLHQVRARNPSDPIIPKGNVSLKGGVRAWAYALALVVLAFPFFNPDVFWHLSAGRWIWEHLAVPRAEAFSFTHAGEPWIDFEWLTQALWYAVVRVAGLWGLWALKIALLVAAFWSVDGLLRDKGASPLARACAAAVWSAAALGIADVRPDLASLVFFCWILRRLEAGRASFLFGFALFALWGNLHAGFPFAFVLYWIYAAAARHEGRELKPILGEALGAALGLLLNPYGLGLLSVLWTHGASDSTRRLIVEWRPPDWHRSFQIPLIAAMLFVPATAWLARRRLPFALTAATAVFWCASALSARFAGFFGSAGAALTFVLFPDPDPALAAFGLAFLTPTIPVFQNPWRYPFHSNYIARRAVEYAVREKDVLGRLRLSNQYEWGGYLGWRMGSDYRMFCDGRYLFVGQLADTQIALRSPKNMEDFVARYGLDGVLIQNYDTMQRTVRVDGAGARKILSRPWHIQFFPRERWALVYFDEQSLLFVDRAKVPADWLAAHEYRWRRPGDGEALADALAYGQVPRDALAAEDARHAAESAGGL